MIRSTVTAAPRRVRVLLAKMVVILVTGVLIFGLSLAGGWGVGYLLLQDSRLIDLTLLTATSLRILLGFVAKMVLLALLSFGIGAWIRSTAGSIGAALGLFILLPFIGNLVVTLSSGGGELTGWRLWLSDAVAFLPTNASDLVLMDTVPTSSILTAWEGLGVLGAWTLLFLVISIIATVRRDL
jgi:ABC-2 type transport system permease protein